MPGMFDQNTNTDTNIDPKVAYEGLVGEGKKYATPEELAKAYAHSTTHISVLESELAELRKQTTKGAAVTEILEELRKTGQAPVQQQPSNDQQGQPGATDVQKLVDEALKARLAAQSQEANKQAVAEFFKEKFGTKAGDVFAKLGSDFGLDLEALSATNPTAVKKMAETAFGLTGQQGPQGQQFNLQSPHSATNPANPQGNATTRSGIIAQAEREGWSREAKYKALHAGLNKALVQGTVDDFNR